MAKNHPATSGYARIAQAEEEEDFGGAYDDEDDHPANQSAISDAPANYGPIQPQRQSNRMVASGSSSPARKSRIRRHRSNSGVDIKAINARLEKWADEIASKFKIRRVKGKTDVEEQLEIHHSVFQAPEGIRPATAETLNLDPADVRGRMTKMEFDDVVESVKVAIELGIHPSLISQGSSGSYFAMTTDRKVVGVFKPKDEEPYASRNPKWTKWIHRNLFPFFFGRACLIPNLSYVSEAAAYVLDTRLQTNIVPYTDIVYLSSKSFYYDFWDRRAYYRKRKPFPQKVGSFQVFLKGYKDASLFLREHPWPDQVNTGSRLDALRSSRKKVTWAKDCRPWGAKSEEEDDGEGKNLRGDSVDAMRGRSFWTERLQQSFREELEKLVILDYIMRNTDRGLDNWMIRIDKDAQEAKFVAEPLKKKARNLAVHDDEELPPSRSRPQQANGSTSAPDPYRRRDPMTTSSRSSTPSEAVGEPTASIGAIDNSLSWPWKHPDAWRSFPFGWLFLPVSLIGRPFSQQTRQHFLPLLTSKLWWSDTQLALRRCFSQDADFQEKMFARQIAVMKGQAWNVVETLKQPDHGPLELTRRARVCVWDDIVEIPVAVPLRAPSAEMRRKRDEAAVRRAEEEEMDISAAYASAPPPTHDLLGMHSPSLDLPNANRFDLATTSNDTSRMHKTHQGPGSPSTVDGLTWTNTKHNTRPKTGPRSRTRTSYDELHPRLTRQFSPQERRDRFSRRGSSAGMLYDADDLEGDLGYAAAEDMEGNRKKVIVERLEMVKSKNPVFTWC